MYEHVQVPTKIRKVEIRHGILLIISVQKKLSTTMVLQDNEGIIKILFDNSNMNLPADGGEPLISRVTNTVIWRVVSLPLRYR